MLTCLAHYSIFYHCITTATPASGPVSGAIAPNLTVSRANAGVLAIAAAAECWSKDLLIMMFMPCSGAFDPHAVHFRCQSAGYVLTEPDSIRAAATESRLN
ncbi:MAG: hypothetical protein OXI01_00975 [Albidovulum sp.]|nr:hypothetical protein [Albidovulum sp.]